MRQYPMDFGRASTCVETIDDPSLERDARRLLAAMRFTGMVEVEFKRDPASGSNLLLDVNPRAWGWQSLGARAGVDFPFLLWRLSTGESVPTTRAVAGVRWVRAGNRPAGGRQGAGGAAACRCATTAAPCAARSSSRCSRATIRCRP